MGREDYQPQGSLRSVFAVKREFNTTISEGRQSVGLQRYHQLGAEPPLPVSTALS